MADKKFTLLELHLGDGTVQIGPATIGDESANEITEPEQKDPDESEDGGACPMRKAGKLLVVLAVLVLLTLGVKKVLGGGEDLEELEDLADLDEDEA
ncbi:hypothetical protein [Haloplanus aerogenes]|uniref:Uncharacterized protein n=1 Tax=Haloplanus aerogenes TaxID=660522 RepID=A0A3M0DSS0_9EURY|nr:hypothetical protein [Haloplanus aerogenes]AZH25437.1 hypothetical protein DU502_08615 [Haloplanus aerogenes]RMB25149.1 hypothetical protein ATH50_0232 [Haloplanus aerogenes]